MPIIPGVLFYFFGGFASGNFYIPYKSVKGWAWESFWITGGIFSWLLGPFLVAIFTVPNFMQISTATTLITLAWTFLPGLLWGIGGLTLGGLTSNLFWCSVLNLRLKTFGDYINRETPLFKNDIFFSALAGSTWFLHFFLRHGASKLGNRSSSWILHMAFVILVSNLRGFYFNEWQGVTRTTPRTIMAGILVIIISVIVVGYGNSIKT